MCIIAMKKLQIIILILLLSISKYTISGAILTVTLADEKSSVISWQCEDITECVERIVTRIEEHGSCDKRVKKIEIVSKHIPGFDDVN